jgi:hypothetical protein
MFRKIYLLGIVSVLVLLIGVGQGNTAGAQAALQAENTPTPTTVPSPHLSLAITSVLVVDLNENTHIDPGDTIRYKIEYRNSGNAAVTNIVLVDDYDESAIVRIENISPSGLDVNTMLQWKFDTLGAGEEGRVIFDAVIKDAFPPDGPIEVENIAMISSEETESLTASNVIEVQIPKLGLSKTRELLGDLNSNGQPDPGDTLHYTITVTNLGAIEASDIQLVDNYDETALEQPLGISAGGVNNGDIISWQSDVLQIDDSFTVTYEVTLKSKIKFGTTVVGNEVTLSGLGFDNQTAKDTFEIEVQPTQTPLPTQTVPAATPPSPVVAVGTSGNIQISPNSLVILVGLLIFGGYCVLVILSVLDREKDKTDENEPEKNYTGLIRDGFIITLIVGAVLTLSLGGAIPHSAATGILGTVAGYLLKRGK